MAGMEDWVGIYEKMHGLWIYIILWQKAHVRKSMFFSCIWGDFMCLHWMGFEIEICKMAIMAESVREKRGLLLILNL